MTNLVNALGLRIQRAELWVFPPARELRHPPRDRLRPVESARADLPNVRRAREPGDCSSSGRLGRDRVQRCPFRVVDRVSIQPLVFHVALEAIEMRMVDYALLFLRFLRRMLDENADGDALLNIEDVLIRHEGLRIDPLLL